MLIQCGPNSSSFLLDVEHKTVQAESVGVNLRSKYAAMSLAHEIGHVKTVSYETELKHCQLQNSLIYCLFNSPSEIRLPSEMLAWGYALSVLPENEIDWSWVKTCLDSYCDDAADHVLVERFINKAKEAIGRKANK